WIPDGARAFCGFYVSGSDAALTNKATMVVMMRDGQRTVLSMQNSYEGPPENFAMVVPVPIVLAEENVRTLPRDVFTQIDRLTAPRLVEYWEQDPCNPHARLYGDELRSMAGVVADVEMEESDDEDLGVTVEARFAVGEYDIVILGASDSSGLDTWLRRNGYRIPRGAEPVLRPYVRAGMKFFVARVDVRRVTFEGNRAMLSPLRFHYDAETFSLPVRLGLLNSSGHQDLIVHILSRTSRYEAANYENYAMPTNLEVNESVRASFPTFYAALFDRMTALHPRAVFTEYAWTALDGASACDPCPPEGPPPPESFMTLGGDVIGVDQPGGSELDPRLVPMKTMEGFEYVVTRLHVRYRRDTLGDDLVLREAPPIVGGREQAGPNGQGNEQGARLAPDRNSYYQARYIIRHPWTGPVECASPQRGIWGGPPGTGQPVGVQPGQNLAFAPRGRANLASFLTTPVAQATSDSVAPRLPGGPLLDTPPVTGPSWTPEQGSASPAPRGSGCASCTVGGGAMGASGLLVAGVVLGLIARRRRKSGAGPAGGTASPGAFRGRRARPR
ncbi:MAG: DUF2330 domain-containing protein, partial [Deltaproteobacteria bacterium]|nr:DUF2330 domain-containing protein [Deltaproteobacteria bacterium]